MTRGNTSFGSSSGIVEEDEMEVTTFAEEEKTSAVANPEEWKQLVCDLGLQGQAELVVEDGEGATAPNPFRRVDVTLRAAIEELCDSEADVKEFKAETIPMGALGALAVAERDKLFEKVVIRYRRGFPDPFMIGKVRITAYSHEWFLLAHWGPEKFCLDTLIARAKARWVEKNTANLKTKIAECQAALAGGMESLAELHFAGRHVPLVH
jgi:hypothetical protein